METLIFLPEYIKEIANILLGRNWIAHSFNIQEKYELYNPCNYIYNSEQEEIKYRLCLDTNIYQYILKASKSNKVKQEYRDAIALVVFCQISHIMLDPTFAVYEKVNYDSKNISNALPDLELFYNIDNTDTDLLARYALGVINSLDITSVVDMDYAKKEAGLMQYRRLKEWDSYYLMMLVITDIKYNMIITPEEKLDQFLTWMIQDYKISWVVTVYAIYLFGKTPLKRMMKFNPAKDAVQKKAALWNMTWDIHIMSQFFRDWAKKKDNEEFFYASNDKPFCDILRSLIEVQKNGGDFKIFKPKLSSASFSIIEKYRAVNLADKNRVYNSELWTPGYRNHLINQYEEKLLS